MEPSGQTFFPTVGTEPLLRFPIVNAVEGSKVFLAKSEIHYFNFPEIVIKLLKKKEIHLYW